ncbi:MAG: oligosaccharide flippase family protein, partial [Halorhabdus sp.]
MGRLARASALQFGVNIFRTAVGAIVTLYFVNVIGAAGFGKYVLVLALVNWLRIPSIAIQGAVVKRISEGTDRGAVHFVGLLGQVVTSVVVAAGILLLRDAVNSYAGLAAAGWIVVIYLTLNVADHYAGVIQGEGRYEIVSLLDAGRSLLQSTVQLILVATGGGVVALLTGELASKVGALVVGIWVCKVALKKPSGDTFRSLYSFARYSWLGSFKQVSYSWVDTLILGFV